MAEKPRSARFGARDARYVGLKRRAFADAYHVLLTMPLAVFFGLAAAAFVAFNALFAGLYLIDPGGVAQMRPGSFTDGFFFSVQTVTTLGYGVMAPKSLYADILSTAEVAVGISAIAAAASILFARISRPTARIMFSDKAVVTPFEGVPTLMFRAANRRRNLVLEAEVSVTLIRDAASAEGHVLRRFDPLRVVRSRSPLFFLTWQVMHPIDAQSPLLGLSRADLEAMDAEILVVMTGTDETFASLIHARTSYRSDEIVWNARLADIFAQDEEGGRLIDFNHFHEVVEEAEG
ncbi:MAG: ion channel [Caulobacteraceae bacterium]